MKTYKEIKESIHKNINYIGPIDDIMNPAVVRQLKNVARKMSNSAQPQIKVFLSDLEKHLRNYGYTFGVIDTEQPFEDSGSEDFVVMRFPDGEIVRNVFITVQWEKTNSLIYKYRPHVLNYSVNVSINEIDPDDFEKIINGEAVFVQNDDDYTGDSLTGDDDSDLMKESKDSHDKEAYQVFVRKMMKKHNFDIKTATDKETKVFFNKIDKLWNSEKEKGNDGLKENTSLQERKITVKAKAKGDKKYHKFTYKNKKEAEKFVDFIKDEGGDAKIV